MKDLDKKLEKAKKKEVHVKRERQREKDEEYKDLPADIYHKLYRK